MFSFVDQGTKTVNSGQNNAIRQLFFDQSCRHKKIFMSSGKGLLLTMYPAEIKSHD